MPGVLFSIKGRLLASTKGGARNKAPILNNATSGGCINPEQLQKRIEDLEKQLHVIRTSMAEQQAQIDSQRVQIIADVQAQIQSQMPPANASHQVAVGAIVLNPKNEVLVVQEKIGKLQGTGVWRIPTGVVDEGENIFMAAVRQVKEETGISTEFLEIPAFRQSHKALFEKSGLFFLCMMRPLSFDIQKQELETEAAQWMPFEKYAAQPFTQKHELFKYIPDICQAKSQSDYSGLSLLPMTSIINDKLSYIYLNSQDLNKSLNSPDQS